MKKRFGIAIIVLTLLAPTLQAQEQEESYKRHEIGVNAGLFSIAGGVWQGIGAFDDMARYSSYNSSKTSTALTLYGHYSLHYYYQLLSWMQLGVKATAEPLHIKYYTYEPDRTLGKESQKLFATFMPSVRFTYINKPKFRLYSGVDLGIRLYSNHYQNYRTEEDNSAVVESRMWLLGGAINVTPIGLTFGRSLYGLFETNLGYDSLIKVGIGYRF